jgi:rSAM/selenodomain-associated transferase 1
MQQGPAESALIVFLRFPEMGKVKTRIASTEGEAIALKIYNELLSITFRMITQLDMPIYLFYEGGLPVESERNTAYSYHFQSGADLGKKMVNALSKVLHHHNKAVLIGSDCPGLKASIVNDAFNLLDQCDVILGPAIDGGYYLIGSKEAYPALFEKITWGTATVLKETIKKISQEELSYRLLEQLTDVDTAEDWKEYSRK